MNFGIREKRGFYLLLVLFLLTLSGCQSEYTRDYLLSHPQTLSIEAERCEGKNDAYCAMVTKTRSQFMELVSIRGDNPEEFGAQIMSEQFKLTQLALELNTFQKELDHVKKEKQAIASYHEILGNYQKMQQDYDEQRQKVQDMLAVISAMSSPN